MSEYDDLTRSGRKTHPHYGTSDLGTVKKFMGDVNEGQGSTMYAAYVNLINSVVGSGILGLPIAFASTGWFLGYILIVIAACASSFSLNLLVCCGKRVPFPATFNGVTEAAYPGFGFIVDIIVSLLCFGNATSYLIVISKLMPEVMVYFDAYPLLLNRQVWVIVAVAIIGPLSFKKSLDGLQVVNSLGLVSVMLIASIIVLYSLKLPGFDPCADYLEQCELASTKYFTLSKSTVRYLGVFVFSYTCQMNLFALVNEMSRPTLSRCNKVIGCSMFTAMLLYSVVAGAGYLTFGNMVESNILVNYPFAAVTTLARIAVSLLVGCSYPLQCLPSRTCFLSILRKCYKATTLHPDEADFRFNIVTAGFIFLSFSIALAVDDLGIVIALVGATGSTIITYVLPGSVYWKIYEDNGLTWKRIAAGGLFVLGCLIMPVCVTFIFL